jgi:hypothetical protein
MSYFDHYIVCSSSIYGFWLHFWYLQTPNGQSRMDNLEKLATLGTQDTRRRTNKIKNTTQYVLDTSIRKQTQITFKVFLPYLSLPLVVCREAHVLFWPLHCLFLFDLRILITLLISSNSSYVIVQFSDICRPAKDHKGYDSAVPVTTKVVSSIKCWKIKIFPS